ncbi:MAG TPA: ABC transporter permease, partial [Pyrinomonadaceae bacterium]|nr:ABC transporter permease [Pyrinomonadaceae bacterium]
YDVRSESKTLENVSAFFNTSFNLTEGEKTERVEGTAVSASTFPLVDARPALGRTFTPEEEEDGKHFVTVLGDGLWKRRFGSDPEVVGRQISLNGRPYTVVGVMPPNHQFPPSGGELWVPLGFDAEDRATRGNHFMRVVGRLRPGVSEEQARGELSSLAARAAEQYPDTNTGRNFFMESLVASYTRGPRPFLTVLLGAVGFVLLLACANVANLLLVRAASRQKEVAIRMALGASRWRLVRQLLTESVMLALLGGLLGLLFAVWGVDLMASGVPASLGRYMPNWENVGLNLNAFYFTLAVSVGTGIVFGLAPALQATRTNFNESLKEGGRTSGSGLGRNRLRAALVVSEVTLSLILLIGAGLMVRSFVRLLETEPGFEAANLLVADLSLAGDRYKERPARIDFQQQLLQRVAALPGVERAAAVNLVPLSRSNTSSNFQIDGEPEPPKGQEPSANFRTGSPNYVETMRIPLKRGRHLDERDNRADAPRALVVNEVLVKKYFGDKDPLGRRLNFGDAAENGSWEVVGVVGNIKHESLEEEISSEVYVPHAKSPWSYMAVVVRTSGGDPLQLFPAVEGEVRSLDREQPLFGARTMEQVVAESLAPQRVTMGMLAVFACIALLLAAIGIYAVMSYTVAQRTHEIGIRMALGAQPGTILRMVVGQGMLLAVVGIVVGLVAAFFLMRGMTRILYGVSATDPATFVGISLALALVALAANFFPARRATKVDPMVALRYE